jgi:hypothetical protein
MAFDSLLLQPKHSGALNLEDAMAEVQVLLSFSSSQGINFFIKLLHRRTWRRRRKNMTAEKKCEPVIKIICKY